MPTKLAAATDGWSQDKQRIQKIFWDQHRNAAKGFPNGRPWWAMCEKQVDGSDAVPCAEMIPVGRNMLLLPNGKMEIAERAGVVKDLEDGTTLDSGAIFVKGWFAPWVPEPKYVNLAAQRLRGNQFRFDYQRMVNEYREANIAYYTRVNEELGARNLKTLKLYAEVTFEVRSIKGIGSPPKSPKVPEAAAAGDLWLLGFSDEENEALKYILARDNGRSAEAIEEVDEPLAGKPAAPKAVPSLSEFATALGMELEDLDALKEMIAAKKARETKKAAKAAEAA